MDFLNRFWSKVDVLGQDECWNWKAGFYPTGYGNFWMNGKPNGAHRIAYLLSGNELIDGMFICHTCDNHKCCNPKHLFQGTPKENTQDMINKGRLVKTRTLGCFPSGEDNHLSKLTKKDVDDIRNYYQRGVHGHGLRILAKKYNVRPNAIYMVVNNLTWRSK